MSDHASLVPSDFPYSRGSFSGAMAASLLCWMFQCMHIPSTSDGQWCCHFGISTQNTILPDSH